jgi:hypothetical protein
MTHCADFFRKWKKEPNFCGLGKTACNAIEKYLEFADEFSEEHGIDVGVVYRNVPQTAVKPIMKFKRDSDIRQRATKMIAQTVKDKHAVTGKYVNTIMGIDATPKKFTPSPIQFTSEPSTPATKTDKIKDKIRLLTSILTTGQLEVLQRVMKEKELDNEYEALAVVIKWSAERLKG